MNFLLNPPALTTAQMVEVDRLMIDEWHISLIQMMENAGRSLAELARKLLGGNLRNERVVVLCGTGNNGGGGMVAARHLHNWGALVEVSLAGTEKRLKEIPGHQWRILQKMGLPKAFPDLGAADLILDALIGYSLRGHPYSPISDWIIQANGSGKPILSLDTPSGLNTDTGISATPTIQATATLTLAFPKIGLLNPKAQSFIGELYLADISVPPELYASPSLGLPTITVFDTTPIIKLF